MCKHLYFVCPSDNLEDIINKIFPEENFFISSLGNSIYFSNDFTDEVNAFIESKAIEKITFVLSDNNKFINDSMKEKSFDHIKELNNFYTILSKQSEISNRKFKEYNLNKQIISFLLKLKVEEMNLKLSDWLSDKIYVDAKVYSEEKKIFTEVQSNLLNPKSIHLN